MKNIKDNLVRGEIDGTYYINEKLYADYVSSKRKSFIKLFGLRALFSYIKYLLFRYQKLKVRKYKIVLLGIDGSGKTTISKLLLSELLCFKPIYIYMGWKKPFSNQLVKIYRRIKYSNRRLLDNKPEETSKIQARSFLELFIYYIEMWHRYLYSILGNNSSIVVYDRYYYDWLVLSRSRIIENFFKMLTPKPDILVYLYAPTDVLTRRKKEAPPCKIILYRDKYETRDYLFSAIKIDTSIFNEKQIVNVIIGLFLEKLRG